MAGSFYPIDATELHATVSRLLSSAQVPSVDGTLRGLIVPHAGYVYSGPVAATAYSLLDNSLDDVVLIGPSHFERFDGLAALDASGWKTPLGVVDLGLVPDAPCTKPRREAFRREHSLEVQLPFLQLVSSKARVVPLLTGFAPPKVVARVLDELLDDGTLLLVSTDLSHYESYETARKLDRATADAILALETEPLTWESACGLVGLQAAVCLAERRGWQVQLLDLRNSGDTSGTPDRVVGYGAFAICS